MDNHDYLLPEMEKFIEKYIDSFLAWDLIVFFHQNSEIKDSSHNLSLRLGRKEKDVREALVKLRDKRLLKEKGRKDPLYTYSPPDEVKEKIDEFVKSLSSRTFRLQVLSLVLRKGLR